MKTKGWTALNRRFLSNLAIAVTLLSVLLTPVNPLYAAPESAAEPPVEILSQMELLAGVLSQTSWISNRGPQGKGSEYYQALKAFMEPYKDHEAVKIAEELTGRGFSYDAPPCFACHLGPLPDLELVAEYSAYVAGRAGGRETLEGFRLALKDLADKSDFMGFLEKWDETLQECIERSSKGFDRPKIETWLTDFFGWEAAEFHVILAPAMFPGGGYGATVVDRDGRSIGYETVRCSGRSESDPDLPGGRSIETLTLHELGHYFVNPSLGKYPSEVQSLQPWYGRVQEQMSRMAYSNLSTYANEQVLRAACAVAQKDLYGDSTYEGVIANEERNNFHLTRVAAEALQDYAANRDKYPKFTDFVPVLLQRMAAKQPSTGAQKALETARFWVTFAWSMVALRWAVIILLVALILWRAARIRKESEDRKVE